ncbi:hypothetical protein ACVGVM_25650 [Pseudonocardia bannensis]|uniref:Peptide zinc metalloprotease protein n=1 Tax=Pseudonocardia bannensis TaxID=630973 RepID=A0A848DPS1_9PSEU|nr:hypothetical protein [Pseudonocardia bannensis]NMH94509.1 hypothetical protein [Pseudonocardia bannensis]
MEGAIDDTLAPPAVPAPRPAAGIELIGRYQGSGFTEPRYLVRRGDGQVVQLSEARPPAPAPTRPDPLLMLRYRAALVPEHLVWAIAGAFRPLFATPVVVVMLAGFAVVDALVLAGGGLGRIPADSVRVFGDRPALILLVLALILVAGGFHECGHAAACRYGGARPGVMGVGLYLVWPAFYSTVTDAYRLDRAGRLRVDLGGVYFNAVSMTVIGTAYLITGSPWLLATLMAVHVETMWQFLPSVRLDGYYILADLVGVPDLFSRLGPVLRGAPPWRETHPRVAELKPTTRRIITLWVALTIPCLGCWVVALLLLAPRVLPAAWAALLRQLQTITTAVQAAHIAAAALGVVQLVLLVLPYAGLALIIADVGRRLRHAVRPRPPGRSAATRGGGRTPA